MAYKEFGATIAPSNVSSSGFPIAMGTHIGGGRIVNDKTTLNLKHWCLLGEGATLNDQKANAIGQIWYDTLDHKYWKLNSWASENPVWVDVSTIFATTSYVDTAINNIPDPMIFKGSLGTGGTITSLPTASNSNTGFTYKVITAGTYAGQVAKVGDTFISDGTIWNLIPSGDDAGGTVTSITLNATSPILIDDSNAITTSGTRTFSHASTSGNKHIPSGGSANNYLKWDSDGTATWSALPAASTSVAGITTVGTSGGAASYVHTHVKSDITDFAHNHDNAYLGLTATATDSDKLDGKHATDFSLAGHTHDYSASNHNHNTTYLGITATATDSDKLDGKHASDFSLAGHGHGNITNAGAIGTTSGLMVKTTTSGVLTTLPAGTSGQFLQYDGTWATPSDTIYTLPLASNGTRGGVQIGYTATGANLPLLLSSEKAYITLTSSSITSALGYTPYNNTNPNGYTTNTGTVTNIATGDGLSGGPITTTGTIGLATSYGDTVNPYASKTAKYVLAAPNAIAGVPTFRLLVASDIPTLNQNTTGSAGSVTSSITFNNGGTGDASGTTYNGSTARTISYNTIGAAASSHTHSTYVNQTLTSGNGMAAWTATNGDLTIALGTPGTITGSSTNSVTTTSHTHAVLITPADIGAAPSVHTHAKSDITDFAHSHAKSDITDFAHSHGNITNTGTISSTVITPASTDYILLSDTSNSGKVERGIAIGSSTSTYLRNDGTWVTPPDTNTTYSIFTTTTDGLVPKTTTSNTTDYLRRDGTWATPPNNNSTTHLYVGASGTNTNGTTTNGNTYIKLFDDSTAREQYKISGSGPSVVTSDATGNIIVGISDNSIGATQLNVTGNGTTTQYLRSDGDGSFTWADITSSNVTTALGYTPYNNTNPNGYTSNTGTVTNIDTGTGLTGGPITSTGTIGLATGYGDSVNPYTSKTAKFILAAPNDANGVPTFRKLEPSDIPALNNSITFNNGGAGDASGTSYNNSAARTISYNTIGAVPSGRVITAGDGLTGGGALTSDVTLSLGTPGTLSNSTTNSVTSTSHTHAISFPDIYNPDHPLVPSNCFNDIWGENNNIWKCRPNMYNGVRDDFGGIDSSYIGDYSTSILIQYGAPGMKIQMLFIPDANVINVSKEGIFYRFENSLVWMRMLDTNDYNNLDQQITNNYNSLDQKIGNNYNGLVQWVTDNFEPKQTAANMPAPVGAGAVITITNAYINKFITTTTPISNGTIAIDYWESYLETEIHLRTGSTVPALNIDSRYKRVNLPASLTPNTTYIIAIKNGVITFAKSV